jgi:hypothetical protein
MEMGKIHSSVFVVRLPPIHQTYVHTVPSYFRCARNGLKRPFPILRAITNTQDRDRACHHGCRAGIAVGLGSGYHPRVFSTRTDAIVPRQRPCDSELLIQIWIGRSTIVQQTEQRVKELAKGIGATKT